MEEQQSAFEETSERYLLGQLSEAERERFEADYFADDDLFERFQAVKDDLLDAYARGELSQEKRARFEQYFLSTAPRRQSVKETQKFIRAVSAVSIEKNEAELVSPDKLTWRQTLSDFFKGRSFALPVALAALLIIAIGATWLILRNWQQANRNEEIVRQPTPLPSNTLPINGNDNIAPAASPDANGNQTSIDTNIAAKTPLPTATVNSNQIPVNAGTVPKATPKPSAEREQQIPSAQVASIMLLPFASRDINEANTLRLNPATRFVRARINFKSGEYRNFSMTVTTVNGANIWQQKNLKPVGAGTNKSVTLQFASALLTGQDYIVTLNGQTATGQTETIGEYYFRVERSPTQNTQTQTPTPEP